MPLSFVFLSAMFNTSALTVNLTTVRPPDPKAEWVEALHQCENPDNIPSIIDTNGKRSYGYVQFQMNTWLSYGKEFGATKENISDNDLQARVAQSMLDKGLWRHWYWCGKRVASQLGEYPVPSASLADSQNK